MTVIVNSSGNYPKDKDFKVFALFRMAVNDSPRLYGYSHLGEKICVSGDNQDEVRAKIHEIVDKLFDGFMNHVDKVVIEAQQK